MVLTKQEFAERFGREINFNEIVIEDLPETELLMVQERLQKDGYNAQYWKAEKQESGHLHIKDIPHLEELNENQLTKYKKLFIKKYVPEELHKDVDFQLCSKHRIAEENKEHYKGYGIKSLVRGVNSDKPNFCDKELFDLAKKEAVILFETPQFEELISQIIPLWVEGRRQELSLSLAGYLRKTKRVGIETAKAVISKICIEANDNSELPMRLRAVDETYNKDESEIKGYTGLKDILPSETLNSKETKPSPQYKVHLDVLTYTDLKKFKVNRNYIVENFLLPGTVTMLYAPPAQFKSLISAGLGFAVSNGREFLGMKTKKTPVLYLDGENSQSIMKERAEQIHKGMRLTRNKFPLFFLQGGLLMDSKKNINTPYLVEIEELIKKEKIKVIIFDTLHRFCLYDENSSDDLNKLYTQVFKPLADSLKVAVVFLHHSTKNGGYRGSGDFLGMVDVSYRVERKVKTNEFTIVNEKCRSGEIPEIKGEIVFGDDYIRFNKLNEIQEKEEKTNKLKVVTQRVEELFDENSKLSRKDIISFLEMQEFEFGSTKTIDRALKFLIEEKKTLDKSEKGVYSLILR